MKKLAIVGFIFLGFNALGQEASNETNNHTNVLYRGFDNKLVIDQMSDDNQPYEINAINCEVLEQKDDNGTKNLFVVRTKTRASTAEINIVSNGKLLQNIRFNVENLPQPTLFWGTHSAGSTKSTSAELTVHYPKAVNFESRFEIIEWTCTMNGTAFTGKGNLLSKEMLDYSHSVAAGDSVTIEVNVRGEDGIVHKLCGSWVN